MKGRGIGGVRAINTTSKTGPVAAARVVHGYEELMMISAGGIVIRTPLETISERSGRATSGVILMNLREGDRLAAIAILEPTPNGGGDEGSGLEASAQEPDEEPDEEALAALPSDEDVQNLAAEASEEDIEDEDKEDDTADDASNSEEE